MFSLLSFGRGRQSGSSVTQILVAVGIAGILALTMGKLTGRFSSMSARTMDLESLDELRMTIATQLDCGATLAAAGVTNPSSCAGAQGLQPMRRLNSGATQPLPGTYYGNGFHRVGKWVINVQCAAGWDSLIIQAARPVSPAGAGGPFVVDAVNGQTYDFANPNLQIFWPGRNSICASNRSNTVVNAVCPAGWFNAGSYYDNLSGQRQPVCRSWPTNPCGANQLVNGYAYDGGGNISSMCRNSNYGGTFTVLEAHNTDLSGGRPSIPSHTKCLQGNPVGFMAGNPCSCPSLAYLQRVVLGAGAGLSNNWVYKDGIAYGLPAVESDMAKYVIDFEQSRFFATFDPVWFPTLVAGQTSLRNYQAGDAFQNTAWNPGPTTSGVSPYDLGEGNVSINSILCLAP